MKGLSGVRERIHIIAVCVLVLLVVSYRSWQQGSRKTPELLDTQQKEALTRRTFSFASYYGSHMVLQKAPAKNFIWGYASPDGNEITVTLGDRSTTKTVTKDGVWKVQIPPVPAGGPYKIIVRSSGQNVVELSDILFGDVWLCSGDDNVQTEKKQLGDFPLIRVFTVGVATSETAQRDFSTVVHPWSSLSKEDELGNFSQLCWFYGVELSKRLKYPIGLIAAFHDDSPVSSWSSPMALSMCSQSKGLDVKCSTSHAGKKRSVLPSTVWNSMIHPLTALTIYGVIWHQGKSDAEGGSTDCYSCMFPAMIDDWRLQFHTGTNGQTELIFPFGFVQLGPDERNLGKRSTSAGVRWHQTAEYGYVPNDRMKNVFMAVSMDLANSSIHSNDRNRLAARLALAGLTVAYDLNVGRFQGPIPTNFINFKGFSALGIEFDRSKGWLTKISRGGFELCCSNSINDLSCKEDRWVQAPIVNNEGNKITVKYQCAEKYVIGMRYAWAENPCELNKCSIYSQEHQLPAAPFIKFGGIEGGVTVEQTDKPTLRFASYYTTHMVLQQSPAKNYIWGYATPEGSVITVTLSGRNPISTVSRNGLWKVQLSPEKRGGPFTLQASSNYGSLVVELQDVLFGDVWICSGQSNMEMTMNMVINASAELADLDYPEIRVFTVSRSAATTPQRDLLKILHSWSLPTKDILGRGDFHSFSAVCWLYGKHLYQQLKYPIGLISSSYGGTPVEAWSSRDALHRCNIDNVKLEGPKSPTALWNNMIYPLLNLTIYGVIWYQGEHNAYGPSNSRHRYNCTFPALIDDWRQKFFEGSGGQTDILFPFGFVQLSGNKYEKGPATLARLSDPYPAIRWHQTADFGYVPNERMKRVFMAVAMDLPDYTKNPYGSIHPRYKQDVAFRLYLAALEIAYDFRIGTYQGAYPRGHSIEGTNLTIQFRKIKVVSKTGFEIYCAEYSAWKEKAEEWIAVPIAAHDQNAVTLSLVGQCENKHLLMVRYAWRQTPCPLKECAIYTTENHIPTPPFVISLHPNIPDRIIAWQEG